MRSLQCLFRVDYFAAKHGQLTTVGGGWSGESCVWTCKALQLGKALGLVADMPTLRSSPESEYRSTNRGEAKEDRCPSDMEGVIGRLVNTEGTSEQYTELWCLRIRLDTDRDEGKQAKLPFPPVEVTALNAKSCKSDESSFWRRA